MDYDFEEWKQSYATFPRAGTMRSGRLSLRAPLAHRTGEIVYSSLPIRLALGFPLTGYGLWPTPAASLPQDNVPVRRWIDHHLVRHTRRDYSIPLSIAVHICPTNFYSVALTECSAATLSRHLQRRANSATGRLTVEYVEWLMGFPKGWTEIDASVPSGMRSSPLLLNT